MLKPELKNLPIEFLCRGEYQPRRQFAHAELSELAQSIQSAGLIQPIVVRPLADKQYEIIAGERRWRAAQLAGLAEIPVLINRYSDEQAAAVATIENINRVDLNPIEEARAYQRLIDEFSYLHEELAAIVGKSRAKITNSLRLLKLDHKVQQYLVTGQLTEGHGRIIASLPLLQQYEFAKRCVDKGLSVRAAEKEIRHLLEKPTKVVAKDPNIQALEKRLGDYLGCQVSIEYDQKKCQLQIDCHNLDVLQGVLNKIGFTE